MEFVKVLFYKYRKRWPLIWPYLIFIPIAIFILWSQVKGRAFFVNGDSIFHVNQFYESAMQIKKNQFSWFLSLFGFGQAGRIVNAVYGPIFSYLVGGLLLLVGTWFRAQMVLEFSVIVLGGFFMYHLSRYMRINRFISLMLGAIYVSSFPITSYVHGQTFDGIGNVFLPLVIMMGIRMWHSHRICIVPISILLAVIFQIHILTAVISVLALLPFAILSFIHNRHKLHWLMYLVLSISLFLILTGNIWGSLLSVFHSNYIISPFPNNNMHKYSALWTNNGLSYFGNLFILIGILFVSLLIVRWHHLNRSQMVLPLLSILFTYLPSAYFPWNHLDQILPKVGQLIQFPYRFIGVAVVLILISIGQGINQLWNAPSYRMSRILLLLALVVLLFITCSSVITEKQTIRNRTNEWTSGRFFETNLYGFHPRVSIHQLQNVFNENRDLNLAPHYLIKATPDYLPSNRPSTPLNYFDVAPYGTTLRDVLGYQTFSIKRNSRELFIKRIHFPIHFKKSVVNHRLVVRWYQPQRFACRYTLIPFVKYHNTRVMMDHHYLSHIKINRIGLIELKPYRGSHRLSIDYQFSIALKLVMILTIVAWLILLVCLVLRII